jgi:hypothetical protein
MQPARETLPVTVVVLSLVVWAGFLAVFLPLARHLRAWLGPIALGGG